jgi:signal transduction histidine kinase/PAS domain-containing protein
MHRKMTDREARDASPAHHAVLDRVDEGVLLLAPDGRVRGANAPAAAMLDSTPDDLAGSPVTDVLSGALAAAVRDALDEVAEATGGVVVERTVSADTEEDSPFAATVHADADAVSVHLREPTATPSERRELERMRSHLGTVLANVPLVFFVLDDDGVFQESLGSALATLDLEPNEVVGRSVFDVYAGNDAVLDAVRRALDGESVDATVAVADREFAAHVEPLPDDDVTAGTVVGLAYDVTDRRRREDEVRETNAALRALATLAIDAPESRDAAFSEALVAGCDRLDAPAGLVARTHDDETAIAAATGFDGPVQHASTPEGNPLPDVVPGRPVSLVDESGASEPFVPTATATIPVDDGADWTLAFGTPDAPHATAATGTTHPTGPATDTTVQPVYADLLARWLGYEVDRLERTAELRERTAELERQNDRLETFAGVVSHDLRSPLDVAINSLDPADGDPTPDDLDAARAALDRMATLVDRTLDLATDGRTVGDTEHAALPTVVEEAWRVVDTGDATLDVTDWVELEADPERLSTLVQNLLRNAVEHGSTCPPSGGREDAVEHAEEHDAEPAAHPSVHVTVGATDDPGFYVADDGVGIPPARRDSVFDSAVTTGTAGAGLGLAIVQRIVEAHGWTIAVTESDAGGARFEITGVDLA